jgi:hypothetical protein
MVLVKLVTDRIRYRDLGGDLPSRAEPGGFSDRDGPHGLL